MQLRFKRHPFLELLHSVGELLRNSLADPGFHGHRPTVRMNQHLLLSGERAFWPFNATFGLFHIPSSAYQNLGH